MRLRVTPRMGGTSSRRLRGTGGGRYRSSTGRAARLDPIIDDGDEDTTDITTYASCGKCFNSMMLSPDRFIDEPSMRVRCNVCDLRATVTLGMLQNIDGTTFDAAAWRARQTLQ